jgi:hypothetical protein
MPIYLPGFRPAYDLLPASASRITCKNHLADHRFRDSGASGLLAGARQGKIGKGDYRSVEFLVKACAIK